MSPLSGWQLLGSMSFLCPIRQGEPFFSSWAGSFPSHGGLLVQGRGSSTRLGHPWDGEGCVLCSPLLRGGKELSIDFL